MFLPSFKNIESLRPSAIDSPGWDDLVAKKIEAPFKPAVKGATDTSASEMFELP